MGVGLLVDGRKSLLRLQDTEHRCQLSDTARESRSRPSPLPSCPHKTKWATDRATRGPFRCDGHGPPARGIRRGLTSRMLRAGPAAPGESAPATEPAVAST